MNKVFLTGTVPERPEIKFTENLTVARFFVMDAQKEKYECFAVDEPAFSIAKAEQHIEEISICGRLHNYCYKDANDTTHRNKFILVYSLKTDGTMPDDIDENQIEQLNRKTALFLKRGYSPLSKITDAYA